jgi:alcohol dehydrogenase (NADP+)
MGNATEITTQEHAQVIANHTTKAYAAQSPISGLAATTIHRRKLRAHDVQIETLFCGVCHTDIHWSRNDWPDAFPTTYPCVPGHEIVGRVASIGELVGKFKVGDRVAVGCMVDSCRACPSCRDGEEQYCTSIPVLTYNAPDKYLGGMTYGGYSESIVVNEDFVLRVPEKLNLAAAAPLLCAGITTYAPLRRNKVGKGQKVGVIGLGGLGHMAVKFAAAFGSRVVLLTTSPAKTPDALRMGADEVVVSTSTLAMQEHMGTFDFILDTVAVQHDLNAYINLLKHDGTLSLVGAPATPLSFSTLGLLFGRRQISGSIIGGIRETQEMLDFCADRGIAADIELIAIQQINDAFERMLKSDVRYRFVIDLASLKEQTQ